MLLNPMAVQRLKAVTAYNWHPDTTHAQRNELARMFNEEATRLLDQKAESDIKRAVERYSNEEISYEEYMELIDHISKEEAERGAAYGQTYARNHAFHFAQKELDRAKERAHALELTEAKKQQEVERRKTEASLREVIEQCFTEVQTMTQAQKDELLRRLAEVQAMTQQQEAELLAIAQQQKDELLLNQQEITESTKAEVATIIATQLQEERDRREQEIREAEDLRPVREAARSAIDRITVLERQERTHQRLRGGLGILGAIIFLALVITLLFFSLPQWGIVIVLAVIASILVIVYLWKSPISRETVANYKRQIGLYQTRSEDYAQLNEEERATLLVQRVL